MNTTTMLRASAIMMLTAAYSALSESMVVNDPAPTMRGNTSGTNDVRLAGPLSYLNMVMSNIISKPMARITMEPATANDSTLTQNSPRIPSPLKEMVANSIHAIMET